MDNKKSENKCPNCGKLLQINNFADWRKFYHNFDKNMNKKTSFCNEGCFNDYIEQFVACNYNNVKIYKIDEKYKPYWDCSYHFLTLEECKSRIDNKNISVIPNVLEE